MPEQKPTTKKAKRAVMQKDMHKYKHGTLHSGSKHGPVVKSRKQAVKIALEQSGQSRDSKKRKRKRKGGNLESRLKDKSI